MSPLVSPDLKQNLAITLYLVFIHNYIPFMYLSGLVISLFLSLFKPSRFSTLLVIAFGILLFAFEYDKHFIVPFREQTIKSLITIEPHYRLQRLIDIIISQLLPIILYILGWLFLFLAFIIAGWQIGGKSPKKN